MLVLAGLLWIVPAACLADPAMRCERFSVDPSLQTDKTVFVLAYDQSAARVHYDKESGPDWFLPSNAVLHPVWVSGKGARVVATWVAPDFGQNPVRSNPVYMFDIDFAHRRYQVREFGGESDASEVVNALWSRDCRPID